MCHFNGLNSSYFATGFRQITRRLRASAHSPSHRHLTFDTNSNKAYDSQEFLI